MFENLCEANSMVRLRLSVYGDFGGASKYITVRMNNVILNDTNSWMSCNQCSAQRSPPDGRFLKTWGTSSCSTWSVIHIYVEPAAWNDALHVHPNDDMQINLISSATSEYLSCWNGGFTIAQVWYTGTECFHVDNCTDCFTSATCSAGAQGGSCGGTPITCDDDNVCTTDSCTLYAGCVNTNNTSSCEDGIFCNGTDTCDGAGTCDHAGDPCSSGCCDETNNGCELAIVSSEPPDGAIDARQPSKPDGSDPAGWDSIKLTMTGAPGPLAADDFSLTVDPQGTAPDIADISVDGDVVTLELAGFIPTGKWTQFTHDCSGTSVCLGYLPADVSNDRTSAPSDILWVIDCLNGIRTCEMWQCDADRSGVCGPPDITRVIDLLNGAGVYDPWLNVSIPLLSPCEAGGESATGGGAGGDLSELALSEVEPADAAASDADFVDGFLTLLTIGPWADDFAAMDIRAIVEALTDWTVVHTPVQERFALAEQLQDPTLTFANAVVAEMIPRIIAALVE